MVTRQELETYWTVDDVLSAHMMLDSIESAEDEARDKAERETPKPPRHRR